MRGEHNPADMLTKYLCRTLLNRHSGFLGLLFVDGRAASAPTLDSMEPRDRQGSAFISQDLLESIGTAKDHDGNKDHMGRLREIMDKQKMSMANVEAEGEQEEELESQDRESASARCKHVWNCGKCQELRWADMDEDAECQECAVVPSETVHGFEQSFGDGEPRTGSPTGRR